MVEILIVIALFGFLSIVAMNVFLSSLSSATRAQTANELRQNGEKIMEQMTRDVRTAKGLKITDLDALNNFTASTVLAIYPDDKDCLTGAVITYRLNGNYLTRNGSEINSTKTKIGTLSIPSGNVDCSNNSLRIILELGSSAAAGVKDEYQGTINFSESVAPRRY